MKKELPQAAKDFIEKLIFMELDEQRKAEDSHLKAQCYKSMRHEIQYQFDRFRETQPTPTQETSLDAK